MSTTPGAGLDRRELTRLGPVRRAVLLPSFQFWTVLPTLALVVVARSRETISPARSDASAVV